VAAVGTGGGKPFYGDRGLGVHRHAAQVRPPRRPVGSGTLKETLEMQARKILVVAPHTDDGELGCGGSIARMVWEGCDVYYVAFSVAEESVPAGFPKDALETELMKATGVLGIPPSNVRTRRFPVRTFSYRRQEILEELLGLRKEIQPDLVFIPSSRDLHQDHSVVNEEGVRAFKKDTVLGYEAPWNNIDFQTQCFIHLEQRHLQKKVEALRCYETQRYRTYLDEEFIIGWARTRGTQVEARFAEAFEVIRWVMR